MQNQSCLCVALGVLLSQENQHPGAAYPWGGGLAYALHPSCQPSLSESFSQAKIKAYTRF
jgi:hypothetical protein